MARRRLRPAWFFALAGFILFAAGLWASQESAERTDAAAGAALRAHGLQLGYNQDYVGAFAAFREATVANPGDSAAYRLLAATAWIDLLSEQGAVTVDDYLGQARSNLVRPTPNPELDAVLHSALQRAITLSEDRLQRHPEDADAHYQVGAAYGVLASDTATVHGRVLGSLGHARRAYREHERVLELDPKRKDAGLIVGLHRYTVSSLPAPLRLLAHLAGFGGDRDRGLRMVEDASRYPSDAQPSALFMLILLYSREARYDDARRVIEELRQRFPRNRLLLLEAGSTALRAGRPGVAKAALEEGLARLASDPRPRALGEEARWKLAYGTALVALKDRLAAERELRAAIAGSSRDWVRGRVHKELGKLADLDGDRARALAEYRMAAPLCRGDGDTVCADEVKGLIKTGYR